MKRLDQPKEIARKAKEKPVSKQQNSSVSSPYPFYGMVGSFLGLGIYLATQKNYPMSTALLAIAAIMFVYAQKLRQKYKEQNEAEPEKKRTKKKKKKKK